MLPDSKDAFPKCLYLDQNKWIALSRAHYGRPDGEAFKDALASLQAAVANGELIVPFSLVNAVEAMIDRAADRRERFVPFIVAQSGNCAIFPEGSVCKVEVANAVRQVFGSGAPTPVRPLLVRHGFSHAIGMGLHIGAATAAESAIRHLDSPEMTVAFLLKIAGDRDRINQARAGEARAVAVFERDRVRNVALDADQRRMLEFDGLFFGAGPYRPALAAALDEQDHSVQDFRAKVQSPQDVMRFLSSIPNLDVLLTLRSIRDRDSVRPIAHNDIRDLDWLSVALPYSNVVVSEKHWGHQVRATGLDARYGTILLTDLRQLPQSLREMGCSC